MNDFFFSLMLLGALSGGTGQPMPFWATANQWGLMPVNQGALAVVQARTEFDAARTLQLRWGASLAANSYADNLDPGSNPLHKMAYEMVGSDWSSDVCSSDRKSTRLNSSHYQPSRMPSSA